jgi:hypothetical protein
MRPLFRILKIFPEPSSSPQHCQVKLLFQRRYFQIESFPVKMDRFVTRAEAFLIPKVVENDDVGTYEPPLAGPDGATRHDPIRRQRSQSHSPDVDKVEFVPLNLDQGTVLTQEQLETLQDIRKVIADALMGLSLNSQEGASARHVSAGATCSSRNLLNTSERDSNCVANLTNAENVNRNPTNGSASDGASNTYNGESDGASQDQNDSSYICRGDGPVHNDAIKTSRLRKFAVNEQSLTNYKGNTENEGT